MVIPQIIFSPHTLGSLDNVLSITRRQPDVLDVFSGKHLSSWKQPCRLTVGEAESPKNDALRLHDDKPRLFWGFTPKISEVSIHPLTAAVGLYFGQIWEFEKEHRHFRASAQDPNRTDPTREMKFDTTGLCTSHLRGKSSVLGFYQNILGDRLVKIHVSLLCMYKHHSFALFLILLHFVDKHRQTKFSSFE